MQVLTFFFFLEDSSTILRIRFVSNVVGNESDDNSYVAYNRDSQSRRFAKRDQEAVDLQRRVREAQVRIQGGRGAKSFGTSAVD